jgi:hypothetical protein
MEDRTSLACDILDNRAYHYALNSSSTRCRRSTDAVKNDGVCHCEPRQIGAFLFQESENEIPLWLKKPVLRGNSTVVATQVVWSYGG